MVRQAGLAAFQLPCHQTLRLSRRTSELVADQVEPAKSDALEKLGEGERAFGIANAWLRTKTTAGAARVVSGA